MAIWPGAFTGVVRLDELVDVALEWMKEQIEKTSILRNMLKAIAPQKRKF